MGKKTVQRKLKREEILIVTGVSEEPLTPVFK
jgi:hypothetical protein